MTVSDGRSLLRLAMLCGSLAMLQGCAMSNRDEQPVSASGFAIQDIAKADIDLVAEICVDQSLSHLRELARKLYVRNPQQLMRGGHASVEAAVHKLVGPRQWDSHPSLQGRRAAEAIHLAFDADFGGDRVAAFVVGMRTMLLDGYGGKRRFYLHDRLDPQKLHYLARNFEIAFWKLGHDRDPEGRLYLLSNSLQGTGDLSFERIAGKLIGLQDHMAQIVADSSKRQIKNVIQGVASAVFFPI